MVAIFPVPDLKPDTRTIYGESPGCLRISSPTPKFVLACLVDAMFAATGMDRRNFYLFGLNSQTVSKWLAGKVESIQIQSRVMLNLIFGLTDQELEDLMFSTGAFDGIAESLSYQPFLPYETGPVSIPRPDESVLDRCMAYRREMELPVVHKMSDISPERIVECIGKVNELRNMVGRLVIHHAPYLTWDDRIKFFLQGLPLEQKLEAQFLLAEATTREVAALRDTEAMLSAIQSGVLVEPVVTKEDVYFLPEDFVSELKASGAVSSLQAMFGLTEEELAGLIPEDDQPHRLPASWIKKIDGEVVLNQETDADRKFQILCVVARRNPDQAWASILEQGGGGLACLDKAVAIGCLNDDPFDLFLLSVSSEVVPRSKKKGSQFESIFEALWIG